MFFKTGVLKSFANFIGKHLCWSRKFHRKTPVLESLLKACNFIKKKLAQMFFCGNCKILKTAFFKEQYRWLLLKSSESILIPKKHFLLLYACVSTTQIYEANRKKYKMKSHFTYFLYIRLHSEFALQEKDKFLGEKRFLFNFVSPSIHLSKKGLYWLTRSITQCYISIFHFHFYHDFACFRVALLKPSHISKMSLLRK